MPKLSPDERSRRAACRAFLICAGEALQRHGMPADRLEDTLIRCGAALGLRVQALATPTSLDLTFGTRRQQAHLIRSEAGDAELARLVALDRIVAEVAAGRRDPLAGRRALRRVISAPPAHGPGATIAAFALASGGAACLFEGNLADVLVSLGLGAGLGCFSVFAARVATLGRLIVPLSAFVIALSSSLLAALAVGVHAHVTTLAALIVLVPGLSLTLAMTELAMRHLVSGTARLAGALSMFVTMAFGVAVAWALVAKLAPTPTFELGPALSAPLPIWARWLALVSAPVGFCVLFQARWKDLGAITFAGVASATVARELGAFAGPELGAFAGALVVGLVAKTYAAWRRVPAAVVLLPGLLVLVPGSLGFQSMTAFMIDDAQAGIMAGFRMVLLAAALVAGLLAANTDRATQLAGR